MRDLLFSHAFEDGASRFLSLGKCSLLIVRQQRAVVVAVFTRRPVRRRAQHVAKRERFAGCMRHAPLVRPGVLEGQRLVGTPTDLRIDDVLEVIPVSSTTWWEGIKDGLFPKGVKIGMRTVAWRYGDIRDLAERLYREGQEENAS